MLISNWLPLPNRIASFWFPTPQLHQRKSTCGGCPCRSSAGETTILKTLCQPIGSLQTQPRRPWHCPIPSSWTTGWSAMCNKLGTIASITKRATGICWSHSSWLTTKWSTRLTGPSSLTILLTWLEQVSVRMHAYYLHFLGLKSWCKQSTAIASFPLQPFCRTTPLFLFKLTCPKRETTCLGTLPWETWNTWKRCSPEKIITI